MKFFLGALLLALFCLADSAKKFKVSDDELDALAELLKNSELEDVEAEFDDRDITINKRFWNPFTWLMNKLKNKCSCADNKCQCCFNLILLNTAVGRSYKLCGPIPIGIPEPLNQFKFCFSQEFESIDDGAVTSCSAFDLRLHNIVGAEIQFKCLQYKDGALTFEGFKQIEKNAMLKIKAKNPFKALFSLFKKKTEEKQDQVEEPELVDELVEE